jgi:Ca2+-dependent lipid-binding protein
VEEFEVRVVVWDTLDVVMADIEGTSDIYIRAFFDSKDDKETDTHFRCTTGKASFNYRLKFTVNDQRKNGYQLNLQVYDKDFFSANEILGETVLNLNIPVEDT